MVAGAFSAKPADRGIERGGLRVRPFGSDLRAGRAYADVPLRSAQADDGATVPELCDELRHWQHGGAAVLGLWRGAAQAIAVGRLLEATGKQPRTGARRDGRGDPRLVRCAGRGPIAGHVCGIAASRMLPRDQWRFGPDDARV